MKPILMLAAVALLGTTSLVAAQETTATENAFGLAQVQDDNMLIVLPLITATADGVVEIRGIAGDQEGEVFATHPVTAGANENVRVSLVQAPNADSVLAVLVVDGVDVATQQIELSGPGSDSDEGSADGGDGADGESSSDEDSGEAGGGSDVTTNGGEGGDGAGGDDDSDDSNGG
jgi:hypothetical protein